MTGIDLFKEALLLTESRTDAGFHQLRTDGQWGEKSIRWVTGNPPIKSAHPKQNFRNCENHTGLDILVAS